MCMPSCPTKYPAATPIPMPTMNNPTFSGWKNLLESALSRGILNTDASAPLSISASLTFLMSIPPSTAIWSAAEPMGTNQVAVDVVSCNIIGFDPRQVEHVRLCHNRGYGPIDMEDIDLGGDFPLEEIQQVASKFRVPIDAVDKVFNEKSNTWKLIRGTEIPTVPRV